MSSDQSNYKIDPNSRLDSSKRTVFGPITRPDKDFKDFLDIKTGNDEADADGSAGSGKKKGQKVTDNTQNMGDLPALSLFDLSAKASKSSKAGKTAGTMTPMAQIDPPEQPATAAIAEEPPPDLSSAQQNPQQQTLPQPSQSTNLFDLASTNPTNPTAQRQVAVDDNGAIVSPDNQRAAVILTTKKNENTLFVEEKPDLASIVPQQKPLYVADAGLTQASDESAPSSGLNSKTLQQIIDQIVDKIYVLKEDGRSDTTIVLKNPPMFDGVKVTLSSFESASGQYNVTFENLTQMAKNVLDLQANQNVLKQALENKGVVIQMFTTTTSNDVVAAPIPWSDQQRDREGGQQQQQQGSGQEQQQEQEQEQ